MEMALYYPGLGYYTKETATIGKKGDFYTSPHLHPVFGMMLGKQMQEMWESMGKPEDFQIMEMGAGMGYLARDMLDYLQTTGLFRHLSYTIVEMNPSVAARQQELLSGFSGIVRWVGHPGEAAGITGCIVSNELLDAFPVRLVEMDDEVMEVFVTEKEGELAELNKKAAPEVLTYLSEFAPDLPKGYRTEVNLRIREWLAGISSQLVRGFILTVDYGYSAKDYYSEDRSTGTLLCYYRHQINETPYQHIGEQDMTAHLNFSSLAKWGQDNSFKTIGFSSQGTYLVSLGIDRAITELYGDAPDPFELAKIKGLIFPQGMGESHQVMVQYKGKGAPVLRGFALRNRKAGL